MSGASSPLAPSPFSRVAAVLQSLRFKARWKVCRRCGAGCTRLAVGRAAARVANDNREVKEDALNLSIMLDSFSPSSHTLDPTHTHIYIYTHTHAHTHTHTYTHTQCRSSAFLASIQRFSLLFRCRRRSCTRSVFAPLSPDGRHRTCGTVSEKARRPARPHPAAVRGGVEQGGDQVRRKKDTRCCQNAAQRQSGWEKNERAVWRVCVRVCVLCVCVRVLCVCGITKKGIEEAHRGPL